MRGLRLLRRRIRWRWGIKFRSSPQEKFWKWFLRHEEDLFHYKRDQEKVFDRVAAELARIDPDLFFEFGSNDGKPDSDREFVISAGGIKRAFPAVVALAAAAPKIPRWQVIAFRPRRPIDNIIDYEGTRVSYRDVWFALLEGLSGKAS